MAGLSKFAPKWEGPLLISEAHQSGYLRLTQMDDRDLMDPINEKWLKLCLKKKSYVVVSSFCFVKSFYVSFTFFLFPLSFK